MRTQSAVATGLESDTASTLETLLRLNGDETALSLDRWSETVFVARSAVSTRQRPATDSVVSIPLFDETHLGAAFTGDRVDDIGQVRVVVADVVGAGIAETEPLGQFDGDRLAT